MANFTERLRQLRDESGKTQSQIAKELGLTPQAFSYFVNGREPNYDTLISIANYFGVTTDYLIGKTDIRAASVSIEAMCKYLGLIGETIDRLHEYSENMRDSGDDDWSAFLNLLILHPDFKRLVDRYGEYRRIVENMRKANNEEGTSAAENKEELKEKAKVYLEFGEKFRGQAWPLFGYELVTHAESQTVKEFERILPELAGIDYSDDQWFECIKKNEAKWNKMYHEVILMMKDVPDDILKMVGIGPEEKRREE